MIDVITKLLSPPPEASVHSNWEAHRNVVIAEWLLGMETRRILMEEQEADQERLLLQLNTIRTFVDDRKEELESLPNLINVTLPPPPNSQFVHYLELPGPCVREMIISFVSDPQDRLNLLEAYPKDEELFKTTRAQLQFEVDFPRWIADERLSWIDDHDRLHQLAGISDHHCKVILEHFENYLVNEIHNARGHMDSYYYELELGKYIFHSENDEDAEDENEEIEEIIDVEEVVNRPRPEPPWYAGLTLPVNLSRLPVTHQIKLNGNGSLGKLAVSWFIKRGGSIWDFHLYYYNIEGEDWDLFCAYLENVPNVRSLTFDDAVWRSALGDDQDEQEVNGQWEGNLELSLLPELPHLKSMELYWQDKPRFFQVSQRLLEKYGGQLNKLSFSIERFPEVGLPPCPNVTILSFTDWTDEPDDEPRNREMVLQFLTNFENAPLKALELQLWKIRGRHALYRMLEYTSLKFGATLERLEIKFRTKWWELKQSNESAPPSWNVLDAIYLPKLKYFETDVNPGQDGWRYLLLIPSLETLAVDKRWDWEDEEEDNDEKIGISEQSIRRFKLWKWLPRLQTIQVHRGIWLRGHQVIITVSREQALLQN